MLEKQLSKFKAPHDIQIYLDNTPYSVSDVNRSPLQVVQDGVAHCLDGALFAAAALHRLGFPPRVINMFPDPGVDDDHLIAIFKQNGGWGAIAKSNTVWLRWREPVYRTLRELIMSYFEPYFNLNGLRSLRTYTRPLTLSAFDHLEWECTQAGVDAIEHKLIHMPRIPLMNNAQIAALTPIDKLSFDSNFMSSNWDGLYKPKV